MSEQPIVLMLTSTNFNLIALYQICLVDGSRHISHQKIVCLITDRVTGKAMFSLTSLCQQGRCGVGGDVGDICTGGDVCLGVCLPEMSALGVHPLSPWRWPPPWSVRILMEFALVALGYFLDLVTVLPELSIK